MGTALSSGGGSGDIIMTSLELTPTIIDEHRNHLRKVKAIGSYTVGGI